jgi:bacteriorhodopsin
MVADLRKQIAAQNATETNKPMLNITRLMMANTMLWLLYPLIRTIKPGANAVINKLVVGGNSITT